MRERVGEDGGDAVAGVVPDVWGELGPVTDDEVLQTVGAGARQLLVVCGDETTTSRTYASR